MDYKEVYEIIKSKLENKEAFSLVRIGDGEHMVLSHIGRKYVMRRQFGYVPSFDDMNKITGCVYEAYINANIIGIPTKHHIENCGSSWAQAYSYLEKMKPEVKDIQKCSIDIHSELLDSGLLHKLIESRDELVYISGRNLDEAFKRVFNVTVTSFIVSAEQLFEKEKSVSHYPDQFEECKKWIASTDVKGKLCLVGAGVLGKYYTSLLKDAGGISIDIGSAFDVWSGRVTRGPNKGVNKHNTICKL